MYWDPAAEDTFEAADSVGRVRESLRVGCIDCLRHPYLKKEGVPYYEAYVEGVLVISMERVEENMEDLQALFG